MTPLEILQLDISIDAKLDRIYNSGTLITVPDKDFGVAFSFPTNEIPALEKDYQFIIDNIDRIIQYDGWIPVVLCYLIRGATHKNKILNYGELFETFYDIIKIRYPERLKGLTQGLEP